MGKAAQLATIVCLMNVALAIESNATSNRKIWVFAFSNDGFPANYFNSSGSLEGQSVDMVRKVCSLAKQDCRTIGVPRKTCWDDTTDPGNSIVLDDQRYGICANLVESPDRRKSYTFPKQSIFRIPDPLLIVKPNSRITISDMKSCNKFKLAFPALTAVNRNCLLAGGFFVKPENVIPVVASGSIVAAMSEIVDLVLNGVADVGIVIPRLLPPGSKVEVLAPVPCQEVHIGLNMMVRVDSQDFLDWWEPTLINFICKRTALYRAYCRHLERTYGVDPLCFTPGLDIDCSRVGGSKMPSRSPSATRIDPCT